MLFSIRFSLSFTSDIFQSVGIDRIFVRVYINPSDLIVNTGNISDICDIVFKQHLSSLLSAIQQLLIVRSEGQHFCLCFLENTGLILSGNISGVLVDDIRIFTQGLTVNFGTKNLCGRDGKGA